MAPPSKKHASANATPGSDGLVAPSRPLVSALHRLLRPLVRLLLANQITYPFLANLLKSVYVELAEQEFALSGKPQTISRLSLLTGIHRKDVKRLREEAAPEESTPPVVSLGAQLVARWTGVPEFLDSNDHPLPLLRRAASGSTSPTGPSFEQLVQSVSKDIRPRAVLDEWLRLGVVRIDAEDSVRLNVEAFVPERGFDEKAHYFGRNLHDHIATAAHNLSGSGPPQLERSVYYDDLCPESVEELSQLAERKGMEALQAVNRRAMKLQARDGSSASARYRMNFGLYFHRTSTDGNGESRDD